MNNARVARLVYEGNPRSAAGKDMRMELALPGGGLIPGRRCGIWASAQKSRTARRGLCTCGGETLRAAAGPRAVAVRAARDDISPYLQGNDILRHLEGCGAVALWHVHQAPGRCVFSVLRARPIWRMLWCWTRWLLWRWSRRPMPLNRRCAMRNGRKGSF